MNGAVPDPVPVLAVRPIISVRPIHAEKLGKVAPAEFMKAKGPTTDPVGSKVS
jgi:hypothetical protein